MKRLIPTFVCFALFLLPIVGQSQGKVYRTVNNETVEKILTSLELKFQKEERKNKDATIMIYDFKRGDNSFRLFNYQSDLWIECTHEKSMKAEDVNRWNADAKFSRLVVIQEKEKTILSLESQLDCAGGVTDAVVKQYINRFDEEAKRFLKLK
jgi:Putative bacterial sensory transduction regulator